jgi:hypothetical protein
VLLRQSAQLHDPSEHAALDATFYERDRASRHYCHRTNYRVQTLKPTFGTLDRASTLFSTEK